jgi:hypothetical protein
VIVAYTLVIGLASYRLWRLVAEDAITEGPREWVLARSPEKVRELIECPWCLGSWLAFGVTWLTDATIGVPAPVLVGLAAAVVVGWLGSEL